MMTLVNPSQFVLQDPVFDLLSNIMFVWSILVASWGSFIFLLLHHRNHGPKVGPTQAAGGVSFSLTKPRLSEEEIFRILTTTEVNIQIVRICETPKSAREIARSLGEIYPGHREKGFPADKLGEHLANLEKLAAVKFNGEKWAASDIGIKMVRKYFG
jgi:hypothetical protein